MLRPVLALTLTALLSCAPALAVPPKAFNTSSGPKMGTRLVKPRVTASSMSLRIGGFSAIKLPALSLSSTARGKDLSGSFRRIQIPTGVNTSAGSRLLAPSARWASTQAFQSKYDTFHWASSRPGASRPVMVRSLTVIRR